MNVPLILPEPQIVHFKKHPYDVYIGRPSEWGNPFSSKPSIASFKVATKAEAINRHRNWVLADPEFISKIKAALPGKILGCWCDNPYSCHGYIIWCIANGQEPFLTTQPVNQPLLF